MKTLLIQHRIGLMLLVIGLAFSLVVGFKTSARGRGGGCMPGVSCPSSLGQAQ